ncbi:MAG TPA: hypothetical protein VFQ61_23645 [Polyangiaceae bacterium]|nr:hypothetical protein [Polyangiaceae bacterium]
MQLSKIGLGVSGLLLASPAHAQDPFGGGQGGGMFPGGGMGGPPRSSGGKGKGKQPAKAPPPGTPEFHAASGASDQLVAPGSEPSLPANPLEKTKTVDATIGSDHDPELEERGRSQKTTRRFYGPYYEEESGKYRLRLAFPVWGERTQPSRLNPSIPDRASVYGLYYNRRSNERADDVLFPLYWDMKNRVSGERTTIVGPLVHREAPDEHDNWLAPFYFTGKRKHGGYTLIPPLLTYTRNDQDSGFTLVGPMFCSWKGGSSCDARTAQDIDLGVAPFYFYGQNASSKYELIPPLLHYYSYDDRSLSWTNLWGPVYRHHSPKRDALHIFPFYYSLWGQNERHTTLFPFFHYGHAGNESLLANPLFVLRKGEHGESTFVTWGYARYRGRTELDMITPLWWHFRDPDLSIDQKLLFPFFYSRQSPRESSLALFPFYGRFKRFGVSDSVWITPFFQHSHDLRGFQTNIHPLVYIGREAANTHTVIAPFFWDFATPTSRTTVGFPLYWRFSDEKEVSQVVGNVFYHEKKLSTGLDWEVHIFPAFSYGQTPDGHWWNVLFGLAGYTRRGAMTQMRTLWIPITLTGDPNKN